MSLAAVLYAKNLERLAEFYTTLGLVVDESERGDFAVLIGPGAELSIVQVPEPFASQIEISDPPQARSRTPIKLVFFVTSVDATLAAAGRLGGRIADGSKRWEFRGHAVQDAIDPEGNQYQLREPLR
jgi:catechol 2,3-dioxygenase-like lactoylglutathione lyase family enzyme